MKFDEETLVKIEDYINELNESVGLDKKTMLDIAYAIGEERSKLKKLNIKKNVLDKVCPDCKRYAPCYKCVPLAFGLCSEI